MVIYGDRGKELLRKGRRIGVATNNEAEYTALIEALQFLEKNHRSKEAVIYTDSQLVVRQMHGEYRVKSPSLILLYNRARRLKEKLPLVRLMHIDRNRNKTADWIVNRVLDNKPYAGK